MNDRLLKGILIVSLAFNLAVLATVAVSWANRSGSGDASRPGVMSEVPIDEHGRQLSRCIGLSGKRAKCFEDVMASYSDRAESLKDELSRHRDDLFHMLQDGEPDEEAIMAKVDRISVIQGLLEKLLVKRLVESRTVLEPEEDERLMYLIRCSMRPGCVGKENCPYQQGKEKE